MAIVYRHRRIDTNEIFYIGIGKNKSRAYQKSKSKRSTFWLNIVNKTDYQVEIIAEELTWEEACELEIFLINEYGRKDLGTGSLVNMSEGGEKPPIMLGEKNYSKTIEGRKKISDRMKGRQVSDETKKKLSIIKKESGIVPPSKKGVKRSEKTKLKHSNSISGSKNHNSKKVICTETNKIWGSVRECVNDNNLVYSSLINKLNGFRVNNTSYKYL